MKGDEQFLDELSIVIVTWDGDGLLVKCLESLSLSCGSVPEIVVVDNANKASTKAIVEQFANAKYLPVEKNVGFSGGNNIGLAECTRRYVLLLNNDTVVHRQPFSEMIQYLKDHPEVAVVQGRMNMPLSGNVLDACGIMLSQCGVLMDRYAYWPSTTVVPTAYALAAKGACLLLDRTIFRDVDTLFYDHFFNNHEETDFCHRVWLSGRRVVYLDTPTIDHLCNQSVRRIARVDFEAQALSNQLFSYLALFGARGLLTVLPLFVLLQTFIALRFLFVGNVKYSHIVLKATCLLWRRRRLVLRVRRDIQSSRKISDSELFEYVMPKHSLKYGWLWLLGRPEEFWR